MKYTPCQAALLTLLLLLSGCGKRPVRESEIASARETPLPTLLTAVPTATPLGPFRALDREFTGEETTLDLRDMSPQRLDEIITLTAKLPHLERIETALDDIERAWTLEELSRLREGVDKQIAIRCRFDLFGKSVSSEDVELVYYREGLGDEQIPTLRQALPLLANCRRLLLDDCGFSYARLAELRNEYPEKGIVWRVRFGQDSAMTDVDRIWSASVTDENCDVLKYCTEVLYIDVGENKKLSDFHFLSYMKKLQVVIVSHTRFADCSFVRDCPELEFLEIDYTDVSDITPLADCAKLKHLSLENNLRMTDITALYDLSGLERLRVSMVPKVPQEQKDALMERLPDCQLIFESNRFLWRFDSMGRRVPRYALLQEQIGYNGHYLPSDTFDWADLNAHGYTRDSVFTAS